MATEKVKVNRIFKDPMLQERYESLMQKGVKTITTPEQEARLQKTKALAEKFFKNVKERVE